MILMRACYKLLDPFGSGYWYMGVNFDQKVLKKLGPQKKEKVDYWVSLHSRDNLTCGLDYCQEAHATVVDNDWLEKLLEG